MTKIETLVDSDHYSDEGHGFLRRQFMAPTTRIQILFDMTFGVVAPVLCFVFDPIVFKAEFDNPLLPQYQAFVYMVSAIEILLLIVWLACGPRLQLRTPVMGGVLMAGALFSWIIGVLILPFTLLGLMLGIGVFGFIPFLTGLVYFRNGRSAFEFAVDHPAGSPFLTQRRSATSWERVRSTIMSCVLLLGPPAGLNLAASALVSQAMKAVVYADQQRADLAIDEIRYLQLFAKPEVDQLVTAYAAENERTRKEELKRRYLKLTGNDIEERLRIASD
jgi:signal transduction histidine kinase